MSLLRWTVAVTLAGLVLTGCARSNAGGGPAGDDAFATRAQQVAASWQAADKQTWTSGLVPLGDLTIVPPDGFPNDATKTAAGNGWYRLDTTLPSAGADGVVVFADGGRLQVPVVGAAEAYQALATGGEPTCAAGDDCGYLTVTGATLTTATLRTSRGSATVPAWRFTVQEMKDPMVRVAIAPQAISPVPQASVPPMRPTTSLAAAQDLTSITGDRIDYRLGVGACDSDIRPLFYETDTVVVIGGAVTPPGGGQACISILKLQPVSVTLHDPVGDRVVIDAVTGQPVLPPLHP
jgi:hypothetical protein